ncbi:MAG: amino acid adenylation domain-containing protein [Planctomycetes bacterium]|nr:amino acid adenylation domain-containing protein [Planctomycetota bacterium]
MTPPAAAVLPDLFAIAAARCPERIAVDVPPSGGRPRRTVTYAELDALARRVAARLAPLVTAECLVAIALPRTGPALYAAWLGVLRVGAAFVCAEVAHPDAALRELLADSGAVALVTDAAGCARFAGAVPVVLDVDALPDPRGPLPRPAWLGPGSLAYAVYTSGTTGRPKGVLVEHRGIVNLLRSDAGRFGFGPGDRIAQGSSPAYDSSLEEGFAALTTGATLVVLDDEAARLGPDLVAWLRRERITVLMPTPTLLRATGCTDPARELPALRLVYAGGEAMPQDLADRWSRALWLENGYGPTECTVTVVRGRLRPGEPVTIGWPVDGNVAHVLDAERHPVADGEVGELWIGGVGVARGYLGRPELTAERFVEVPGRGRLYRTGDLVRRGPDGALTCLGRADQQVKLRGHRIELEEIEARLAALPGVAAAACRVHGDGAAARLAGYVVPALPATPPDLDAILATLRRELPGVKVPSRIAVLSALPTTVGGKLDRARLPVLDAPADDLAADGEPPRDELERQVATAFARCLGLPRVGTDVDFFDAGGDSVRAAELVSALRGEPATAAATVRDVYRLRTARGLAGRLRTPHAGCPAGGRGPTAAPSAGVARPLLTTALQALVLLTAVLAGSAFAWLGWFRVLPWLVATLGVVPLLLVAPFLAGLLALAWLPVSVAVAVVAKRALIGTYRPALAPVWGGLWLRHWIVTRAVRLVPFGLLVGTVFQAAILRALGARIGRRVHLHRGVDLTGAAFDLLEIGDGATLARDAAVRTVELRAGHIAFAAVRVGRDAVLDVRAGMAGDTELGDGAELAALSSLPGGARVPAGERWDGVPARPAGKVGSPPAPSGGERAWSPLVHGVALVALRGLRGVARSLATVVLAVAAAIRFDVDTATAIGFLLDPLAAPVAVGWILVLVALQLPLGLCASAVVVRAVGRVSAGVYPRFGATWLRVWLRTRVLEDAGTWLSGSVLWPGWLRLAGMRVGPGCEISTIVDVLPEQVTIGAGSFFADGIYLGGPRVDRGTVTVAPVALGPGTFLGNHVVVTPGTALPGDVLLGVCTVADATVVRAGTSWFGHPPFELPRREVVTMDRRLTHAPSLVRRVNRVLWELLRFALPAVSLALLVGWIAVAAAMDWTLPGAVAATLVTGASAAAIVLVLKWALLGRVQPGRHALWSCWCSRWDFVYVAWQRLARNVLAALEGTLLLTPYLRAMGMRIGRRVVLGRGFAQVVDPDMLSFGDGATVDGLFQAHSFEDRVLKIDRVTIHPGASVGANAVLMYGAELGAHCRVEPHTVVMKHERLTTGGVYEGCPATDERNP